MFHYPILCWNGMYRQSYHIHGHIYIREEFKLKHKRAFNAGVDVNNSEPKTLNELIDINMNLCISGEMDEKKK